MTGRGKSPRPRGAPTETLPPVTVAPEFVAKHECRTMRGTTLRLLNVPPMGWQLRGHHTTVIGVVFCPFCGAELENA